jgi:sporulation protein YqfD
VLLLGILLMLFSAIILPRHVLFIQVEGNKQLPDKRIIEAAENCGIRFGTSRKHIRSEKVKNDLLSSIPELQWAGVNTKGCVAVISVRERTIKERHLPEKIVSNIIADRDGFIISCTASKGNLICTQGQAVRKGELLISGYTDCGISIHATRAEGEVFAQTLRNLSVIAPKNWVLVADNGNKIQSISLLIGKKRINLWKDSGIWSVTCGRMYKEYFMTLPGGFSLPLALCLDVRLNREHLSAEYSCGHTPEEFARDYLRRQMVAGTILQEDITVADRPDYYMLQGNYICSEMIGRVQSEVIGEQHGKTS